MSVLYLIGDRNHGISALVCKHDLLKFTVFRHTGSPYRDSEMSREVIVIYRDDKLVFPVKSREAQQISAAA